MGLTEAVLLSMFLVLSNVDLYLDSIIMHAATFIGACNISEDVAS